MERDLALGNQNKILKINFQDFIFYLALFLHWWALIITTLAVRINIFFTFWCIYFFTLFETVSQRNSETSWVPTHVGIFFVAWAKTGCFSTSSSQNILFFQMVLLAPKFKTYISLLSLDAVFCPPR